MLSFELNRDRKTHEYTLLSFQEQADDFDVKYTFRDKRYPKVITQTVMPILLGVLDDIPFEPGLHHFPDFSCSMHGIEMQSATVFHNTSSLNNASVKFRTEVQAGSATALMADTTPAELSDSPPIRRLVELLLDTTVQVLNINLFQINRLKHHLHDSERRIIEDNHTKMVSLVSHAARVAVPSHETTAGLEHALAGLYFKEFRDKEEALRLKAR